MQQFTHNNDLDETSRFRESMRRRRHYKKLIKNTLWWSMLIIAAIIVTLVFIAYIIDR